MNDVKVTIELEEKEESVDIIKRLWLYNEILNRKDT